MLRRDLLRLVLIAAPLLGCAADTSTSPLSSPASFIGTWKVATVNGAPVPYILRQFGPGESIALQSGTFTITSDSKWTYRLTYLINDAGNTSTQDDNGGGQWSQTNGTLSLYNPANGEIISGTFVKGVLTLSASLEGITDYFALGLTH